LSQSADIESSSAPGERAIVLAIAALALWSALATAATFAGVSFLTLCIGYGALLPLVTFLAVRWSRASTWGGLELGLLCAACALLAYLDHRPNLDDAYYFGGRTIFYLDHPEAVVDLVQHQRALLDWPAEYPLVLLQHVSLLWAAIAWVTGTSGLAVIHFVAPALGGALLPLAWHSVLSRFLPSPRAAVVGTAAVIACLCLDGAVDHGFGWFGFPALRLGKGLLMMIGLPLFVAWAKDWFARPTVAHFAKVALVTVACAGLSDSALFLMPMLSLFIVVGACFSHGVSVEMLRRLSGFGLALSWMLGVGIFILLTVDRGEMADLGFGYGFPDNFADQFAFVFGAPPGFFFWLYAATLLGAIVSLRRTLPGRFLLGWTIAALLLLNPAFFGPITETLTSYNGYWRLFYLPPFLLGAGLASGLAAEWIVGRRAALAPWLAPLVVGVAGMGTLVGPFAADAIFAQVPLAWTGYKVDGPIEEDVGQILEHARPGPMLAPRIYSQTIPLYTSRHPQVAVRGYMLRHTAIRNGAPRLAASRLAAVECVTMGRLPSGSAALLQLLRNLDLANVVIAAGRERELGPLLARHGFEVALRETRFSLFVRR
jgi:hypothetical protein